MSMSWLFSSCWINWSLLVGREWLDEITVIKCQGRNKGLVSDIWRQFVVFGYTTIQRIFNERHEDTEKSSSDVC